MTKLAPVISELTSRNMLLLGLQSSDEVTRSVTATVMGALGQMSILLMLLVTDRTTMRLVDTIVEAVVPIHVGVNLNQREVIPANLTLLSQEMTTSLLMLDDDVKLAVEIARTTTTLVLHANCLLMMVCLLLSAPNEGATIPTILATERGTGIVPVTITEIGTTMTVITIMTIMTIMTIVAIAVTSIHSVRLVLKFRQKQK